METLKRRYPWRLGATSFVLPAGVEENVRFLADKVDDIQLLFFESPSKSPMPQRLDMELLRSVAQEHDVSYTVHLPLDIRPGSHSAAVRQDDVHEIVRLMEELAPLQPLCFDLHLPREDMPVSLWMENLDSFLVLLKRTAGSDGSRLAIENIEYPFGPVRTLALENGFQLCVDIGHGLFFDHDMQQLFEDIPRALHIHYHGVVGGKDHQALPAAQSDLTVNLAETMTRCGYGGVVTIEVYNEKDLYVSLQHVSANWHYEEKNNRNEEQ